MAESIQYWATTNAGNANSDPAIASSDTQAPNTVATNIRSIMTALAKARLDVFGGLTAGGTPNALTVTTNQVLLSAQLTGGAALMIKAASTNTSATVTFAPDGLTAAPIKRADGNALAVGSIQAGMFLFLVYNSGTSEWWCLNIAPASAAGSGLASFSAVKSSSQSVSSTTWTQLTFNTLTYNTGSYFSSNAWTPPAGACLLSLNVEMNGIVSGVFERLPELRIVLGDVSVHEARALAIRTDKDWQSDRVEVPWMTKEPTAYLERHVRFVTQPEDEISPHSHRSTGTLGGDNSSLVVFGSRHPYWDGVSADDVFPKWSGEERARCLAGNAVQFYPRLAARFSAELNA